MKLLLVNPNTSAAMTQGMAAAAQAVAAQGTVVVGRQPSFGPASIESHFDEVFGVPAWQSRCGWQRTKLSTPW